MGGGGRGEVQRFILTSQCTGIVFVVTSQGRSRDVHIIGGGEGGGVWVGWGKK